MSDERTYDWSGETHPIRSHDLTDEQVAFKVRMLMRGDIDHEAVCLMARDRIMALVKENAKLVDETARLRAKVIELEENVVSPDEPL